MTPPTRRKSTVNPVVAVNVRLFRHFEGDGLISATGVPACGDWLVIRHVGADPILSFITSCPSGAMAEMFTQSQNPLVSSTATSSNILPTALGTGCGHFSASHCCCTVGPPLEVDPPALGVGALSGQ